MSVTLETFAGPTSQMSEAALARGYGMARVERCACGGEIESIDGPESIALAVAAHNQSTRHAQWRAEREAGC